MTYSPSASFFPLFEACPTQMQGLLNGVAGVYRFLANCAEVADGCASYRPPAIDRQL